MPAPKRPATPKQAVTKTATKTAKKAAVARPAPAKPARMTVEQVMTLLEKSGSEQTRKIYLRHGAEEPLFGVSFALLKTLVKRIGVDHELACALWDTGNSDARTLAVKVADPARMSPNDLDRWARSTRSKGLLTYVAQLAGEGPHAFAKAHQWLASSEPSEAAAAWVLVGDMALRHEATPDSWFAERVAEIEAKIRTAPNSLRDPMNHALIAIGGRTAALRKTACAAAKRIGAVVVDHGDTSCKTPAAVPYIDKMWAHAETKGYATPAAQERAREPIRTRC